MLVTTKVMSMVRKGVVRKANSETLTGKKIFKELWCGVDCDWQFKMVEKRVMGLRVGRKIGGN